MKKMKVILIGAGARGVIYTDIMAENPEKFEVVAVADAEESRRNYIKEKHNLPDEMCFDDWKSLLDMGKIADVAIISTQDRLHYEPAMKAISLKYDLLLEKPVSPFAEECFNIAKAAEENDVKVIVCHVLRYAPLFIKLKELIDGGALGKVMSVNHEECVGVKNEVHSYVRGNWRRADESAPMLLAKSCHDLDILQWLIGKSCKKIQSFGALSYFTRENAPKDAPEFCIEGCPHSETCPYNAVEWYLEEKEDMFIRRACTKMANPTDDDVKKAISTTEYGKCAFKCDNDVVDHQTVNMLFEDNVTVTFTMNGFNEGGRFIHIMGTKGEVRAALDGRTPITVYSFETKETTTIDIIAKDGIWNGHGGGDAGIVETLYQYLCGDYRGSSISSIKTSCDNHLLVFAAEKSRETDTVVDIDEYIKSFTE